ncbi:MAG: hypothetical protein R3F31_07765 [Verrucomicrobiales bacterium]
MPSPANLRFSLVCLLLTTASAPLTAQTIGFNKDIGPFSRTAVSIVMDRTRGRARPA